MNDSAGLPQVCIDPALPGVGEHLSTVRWLLDCAAEVKRDLCGIVVGCHVVKGKLHSLDRSFWLAHFTNCHPEKLPEGVRT